MNRRQFVSTIGAGAGLAVCGSGLARAGASQPNLIVIVADDMGYSDIGCMGSEIQTPNLDRLAGEGMLFPNFYNASRCCPSRASLLTGLYPHQAGVGHMTEDQGKPAYQGYLNRQCVTIAEAVKPSGYRTMMCGKWHLTKKAGHLPNDRGFDEYFGVLDGSSNYFRPSTKSSLRRNTEPVEVGADFYTTDAFTAEGIQMINRCDGPYFLYMAYNAPHWPLQAPPEDIAKYEDRYLSGWDKLREERYERMKQMGIVKSEWPLSPRDRGTPPWNALDPHHKKKMARKMAVYAAMVDRMDQNIGKLIKAISDRGELDNTMILFLSDNGACQEVLYTGFNWNPAYAWPWDTMGHEIGSPESFASYGRGWSNLGNTPFRLHKHWTNEGGISTPLIAHWPAMMGLKGTRSNEVGHIIDVMATCLDAVGAPYPAEAGGEKITPLEGKSLLPVFRSGTREGHDHIGWEHEGNRALRRGRYKLVSDYPGRWKLYDMEADRVELNDLSRKMPEKAKELADLWQAWADHCGVAPWNPIRGLQY